MNSVGGEFEPNKETDAMVLNHLDRWIAAQNTHFDTRFHELQEEAPNLMNSSIEILESIREASRLIGKKELLDELKHEFSQGSNRVDFQA